MLCRCTRRSEIEELFKYFHFDVDELRLKHDIENWTSGWLKNDDMSADGIATFEKEMDVSKRLTVEHLN